MSQVRVTPRQDGEQAPAELLAEMQGRRPNGERIGRDLHDVAGHALSSISLKAQVADKLLSKGPVSYTHLTLPTKRIV